MYCIVMRETHASIYGNGKTANSTLLDLQFATEKEAKNCIYANVNFFFKNCAVSEKDGAVCVFAGKRSMHDDICTVEVKYSIIEKQ